MFTGLPESGCVIPVPKSVNLGLNSNKDVLDPVHFDFRSVLTAIRHPNLSLKLTAISTTDQTALTLSAERLTLIGLCDRDAQRCSISIAIVENLNR